jgi:hypothetical protein
MSFRGGRRGDRRGISHCVENSQSEILLPRLRDRNDAPKEVFTEAPRPFGGRRHEGFGPAFRSLCAGRPQGEKHEVYACIYRVSTLALRGDFLSLGQRHNIGYYGIRLQARRSRPAGKTMRQCWWPLEATWRGGLPGQTKQPARLGASNRTECPFRRRPNEGSLGENDLSPEFPHKGRSELRSNVAATLAQCGDAAAARKRGLSIT